MFDIFLGNITKIDIWQGNNQIHILGKQRNLNTFRAIIVDLQKLKENDDFPFDCSEILYPLNELKSYYKRYNLTNYLTKGYGILGIDQIKKGIKRFLYGYYLIVITKKKLAGIIGGLHEINLAHKVYSIEDTKVIRLFEYFGLHKRNPREDKYLKIFKDFNLNLGFYFSQSLDLTNHLFRYMTNHKIQEKSGNYRDSIYGIDDIDDTKIRNFNLNFLWNYHLLLNFHTKVTDNWVLPVINGFFDQAVINQGAFLFSLTLIARRSRKHAGTRYIKRGLDERGYAANFVEIEQIVVDLNKSGHSYPNLSSFLQIRGSIPVYWYQESNVFQPKPTIKKFHSDPYYHATKKHFSDLLAHYGPELILMDLVKTNEKTKREAYIAEEYRQAVDFLNSKITNYTIKYHHIDMKDEIRRDKEGFIEMATRISYLCILKHGIFLLQSDRIRNKQIIEIQKGIIRTNCIDCLDRTNLYQKIVAEVALGIQLKKLQNCEIIDIPTVSNHISLKLRDMYDYLGDFISIQYGGSVAHKQSSKGGTVEFMTSIKRHLANSFNDQYKQQTFDIFLGEYIPKIKSDIDIWQIPHNIMHYPDCEKLFSRTFNENKWHQNAFIFFIEFQKDFKTLKKRKSLVANNYFLVNKMLLSYRGLERDVTFLRHPSIKLTAESYKEFSPIRDPLDNISSIKYKFEFQIKTYVFSVCKKEFLKIKFLDKVIEKKTNKIHDIYNKLGLDLVEDEISESRNENFLASSKINNYDFGFKEREERKFFKSYLNMEEIYLNKFLVFESFDKITDDELVGNWNIDDFENLNSNLSEASEEKEEILNFQIEKASVSTIENLNNTKKLKILEKVYGMKGLSINIA